MVDPEDVGYKCTLNEYSLQKAQKELNEDPKERLGAVKALRKWIREQPHYTCRLDTRFLLTILRRAKFSQLVARELIDNILTMKTLCPEFMSNLDLQDPSILGFIETGAVVYPEKFDKEGRRIVIIRPGVTDMDDPRFNPINEVRSSLAMQEMFRDEEENVGVNGVLLVFDCTGVGPKRLTRGMEHNKKTSRIYQDCNPERVKAFIFYNAGPIFEMMMGIMKSFLKKKNQERMQAHDTMESLYKVIPMELWPTEYLPDDYKGPSAGSIASIAKATKQKMMNPDVRARILAYTSDRYKVDESKRPKDVIPNASFRKLNLD